MPSDPQAKLKQFTPTKQFFVGVDSDGCAFNSMEVKHNDCFSVAVVRDFGLAAISRQVHHAWDFVNLYSQMRGCNRFKALLAVMDLLQAMPRVKSSGVELPALTFLRDWVANDTQLSNARLKELIESATGAKKSELEHIFSWSKNVNLLIEQTVHDLPPFPGVKDSLIRFGQQADVMVVSATPAEALEREWAEHGIDSYVGLIAGQEMGSKTEHLTLAAQGKYASDQILMIGDAPGDMKAARDVGALFYPINPGAEEDSWARLLGEGMERFFTKRYQGGYEKQLVSEFMQLLPAVPPWQSR